MSGPSAWEGRLEIRCSSAAAADRLYQVLAPEASREVPRARAILQPPVNNTVVIQILARDTGAIRAAVQTYLGWVHLEAAASLSGGEVEGGH